MSVEAPLSTPTPLPLCLDSWDNRNEGWASGFPEKPYSHSLQETVPLCSDPVLPGRPLPLPASVFCLESEVDVSQLKDLVHGRCPWNNTFEVFPGTCEESCRGSALGDLGAVTKLKHPLDTEFK